MSFELKNDADRAFDTVLALSGGMALGAYQAGAYAALHEREALWPTGIAGTSVGAVNGAIILGNEPFDRDPAIRFVAYAF